MERKFPFISMNMIPFRFPLVIQLCNVNSKILCKVSLQFYCQGQKSLTAGKHRCNEEKVSFWSIPNTKGDVQICHKGSSGFGVHDICLNINM